ELKGLITLSELFQDKIFRIPDYQRGYAWQESQLRDFWEDIINLPKGHSHYTGMISLKELTSKDIIGWDDNDKWIVENKVFKSFHVIDGKQRLTTFIVLLKCVVELAENKKEMNLKDDDIESIKKKYLYEDNKTGVLRAYKFG